MRGTVRTGVSFRTVAHLHGGHVVTLFAVGAGGVTVGDPARGVLTLPPADFLAAWSGVVVPLRP